MTTKVFLRQKKISQGRNSLYLDFYPPISHPITGKSTRREFLRLYTFDKPLDVFDKDHNREVFNIARAIRSKRENELNKPEIYYAEEKEKLRQKELGELDFIQYCRQLAGKRSGANQGNWLSAIRYFSDFAGKSLRFADLSEMLFDDFRDFLLDSKLSQNSASSYFAKIRRALREAFKEGIIQIDLGSRIEGIKAAETHREFLTLDELNSLAKTPCKDENIKRAGLFSALTGLRISDIQNLTLRDLKYIEGQGYFLNFSQCKTGSVEFQPISDQAAELLGKNGHPDEVIFPDLKRSVYYTENLKDWLSAAGITKKFTFHCFRHTFATLQLFHGSSIFEVSKLLGHRNLKNTQIYTKIVDEAKRAAANRIQIEM